MSMSVTPAAIERYRTLLAGGKWHAAHSIPPAEIASWLLHQGSLTAQLQQICRRFTVQLVNVGWVKEKTAPKSTALTEPVWLREVILQGDGSNWIFAQTRLPQRTVANAAPAVIRLADQPIGPWLFAQKPQRLSLGWRRDRQSGLYARRSVFSLAGYPLEIKELFLADFDFHRRAAG
ncbi:chorismate--pyruvate lyase family protein [Necropsobacter rosorum]|uniref:chorismate--pyruvate lyase family protein n=1 Tax=Necropsobacter rosorum TaxID=908285 RepID=UPI003C7A8604